MSIKYFQDGEVNTRLRQIANKLGMVHDMSRVVAIRSRGSASRRILARCHTMGRAVQTGLGLKSHYIIEVVSENFDKLSQEEQAKTLIHELLHIPKAFGGGFKGHHVVNRRAIDQLYKELMRQGNN